MTNMDKELRIKALVDMLRREISVHEREERSARDRKMVCFDRIDELERQLYELTGKMRMKV